MAQLESGIYGRSCAPCASSKRSCDHGQPVCGRCLRLGIADRCVPAPDRRRERIKTATADIAVVAPVAPVRAAASGAASSQALNARATAAAASTRMRSCAPCAVAKRFCDRDAPCARCVRLCIADKCTYTGQAVEGAGASVAEHAEAVDTTQSWQQGSSTTDSALAGSISFISDHSELASTSSSTELVVASSPSSRAASPLRFTSVLQLTKSPLATLHDRVLHAMCSSLRDDRFMIMSIPAVPLAVPLDMLQRYATGSNRVRASALMSESSSAAADAQAVYEGATRDMMSTSSKAMFRVVYAAPDEFDLSCGTDLRPHLVYANAAWLYTVGMRLFMPWSAIASSEAPLQAQVPAIACVPALRMFATIPMVRPAKMASCTREQVFAAMRKYSDEQIVDAFSGGCMLVPPGDPRTRPNNYIAAAFQQAYFNSFAGALLRGSAGRRVRTRLEFGRPPGTQLARSGSDQRAQMMQDMMRRRAEVPALFQAQPSVAAHLMSPRHTYFMEADESILLTYTGMGMLSTLTLMYEYAVVIPPAADAAVHMPPVPHSSMLDMAKLPPFARGVHAAHSAEPEMPGRSSSGAELETSTFDAACGSDGADVTGAHQTHAPPGLAQSAAAAMPSGRFPPGMPPGMLPPGFPFGSMPRAMPPGMIPPGMMPPGMMPPGMMQPGMPPLGVLPPGMLLPPGMPPPGMLPPGMFSPGMLPPGMQSPGMHVGPLPPGMHSRAPGPSTRFPAPTSFASMSLDAAATDTHSGLRRLNEMAAAGMRQADSGLTGGSTSDPSESTRNDSPFSMEDEMHAERTPLDTPDISTAPVRSM